MTFPLLQLPGEVRKIIYEGLFFLKRDDLRIKPDPIRPRRKIHCGQRTLNINSLTFLTVCKQLNSEGSAVLYGGKYNLGG